MPQPRTERMQERRRESYRRARRWPPRGSVVARRWNTEHGDRTKCPMALNGHLRNPPAVCASLCGPLRVPLSLRADFLVRATITPARHLGICLCIRALNLRWQRLSSVVDDGSLLLAGAILRHVRGCPRVVTWTTNGCPSSATPAGDVVGGNRYPREELISTLTDISLYRNRRKFILQRNGVVESPT